jgi:hypothetical protein
MARQYGGNRTERLGTAYSKRERRRVLELAALHGLTVAEYIRMKSLEDPIERVS